VATGLRELGAAHQATLFMVTLAAHHALLAWYSGQRDFVVATPVSWRDRPEIDALVGAFINYVPLRADLSGNLTFAELVDVVRDQTALDLQNHDLPYDEVCALAGYEPTQGRHALLRVLFTEEADPSVPPTGSDALRAELVEPPWHHALRDFTTRFTAAEDGTYIIHTYRTDAFTADRIAAIAEDYRDVLARVVAEPHRRVFEAEGPFGVALRVPPVNHAGGES
jgi:non-ribosomal peptide synthetase component F